MQTNNIYLNLLGDLISIPSPSGYEENTATLLTDFIEQYGFEAKRHLNNVYALSPDFNPELPTILLNSHHDTVKPAQGYTRNPFEPTIEDGKLFGLGSNDAGVSVVALTAAFIELAKKLKNINLVLALVAEEENSGANGIEALLPLLPQCQFAIVGEPTQLKAAVAQKGLMVVDGQTEGKASHAAYINPDNALYKAIDDITAIRAHVFEGKSELLGPTSAQVTIISAGSKHNIVPDRCNYTIDIRTNEIDNNQQALSQLEKIVKYSKLTPRSTRLQAKSLLAQHPVHRVLSKLNIETFGSTTMSDMALVPFPAIKIGAGDSLRSHTADEYIFINELEMAIDLYIRLLSEFDSEEAQKIFF